MILLVDAGNTRIKWRIVKGRELTACGTLPTNQAAALAQSWHAYPLTGAVLSCVADASVQADLTRLLVELGVAANWLQPVREKYSVLNLYDAPEKLGADRYAGLIAAARLKVGNCVVVSVGTATTVDMLAQDGTFLGGVILPGPDMMRTALLGGTGQIEACMAQRSRCALALTNPAYPLRVQAGASADPDALPRDTDTAVGMGIALAQAGAVRAMCERMQAALERPPLVILTGGGRAQVRNWLSNEVIEIEDLVLEGLAWIALDSNLTN